MSDTQQITENEAIRQILTESSRMDYVDVVHAVQKRFRLNVTAIDVELVAREIAEAQKPAKPRAQVSLDLSSNNPSNNLLQANEPVGTGSSAETDASPMVDSNQTKTDLDHALLFVKSVGGLAQAKLALAELESVFIGRT